MAKSSLVLVVITFMALSGCADAGRPEHGDGMADPIVHTRPDDLGAMNDPDAFHLHDYWNGQELLPLMEETRRTTVTTMGASVLRERFRPEAGHVVPLGTGNVTVTLSWSLDPGSQHGPVWLYVKTQADNVSEAFQEVQNGEPVVFPSTNAQNDLPHQILSAWSFDLYLMPDPSTGILRFNGDVSIEVTVARGLEIPLFPPHPDHWRGRTEIVLFDDAVQAGQIDHAPAPNRICTGGCLPIHVPTDGAIVPLHAESVVVTVAVSDGATGEVRLGYHRADTRTWTEVDADAVDGGTMRFELPVEKAVDGPYASSSLWEFQLSTIKVEENGWFDGAYTMKAVAVRGTG